MRRAGTFTLAAVTAACAIGIAAGGAPAAQQTSPAAWAHTICTSVGKWSRNIQKHAGVLQHLNGTNVKGVKGTLVSFLVGSVGATDTLIASIKHAGTPKIPNGKAATATLIRGFTQLRAYYAQDAARAKKLSTSPARFVSGATSLARTIGVQSAKVATILGSLKTKFPSKALDKAFNTDTACS